MSAGSTHRSAALTRQRRRHARLFRRGVTSALILPAWIVGFSQFGVGALGADIGLPLGMVVLSTPLIWAGPAQFVLLGTLAAGAGLVAIALAVTLTAVRLLPMGISVLPLLHQRGQGLAMRLLLAHLVVVTTWLEGIRQLPGMPRRDRVAWFLGFSLTCIVVSTFLIALGHVLSASLPRYLAAGFMVVTPLYFLLSLLAAARMLPDYAAVALGLVFGASLGPLVGPDLDLIVAGLVGGLVAFGLWRRRQ